MVEFLLGIRTVAAVQATFDFRAVEILVAAPEISAMFRIVLPDVVADVAAIGIDPVPTVSVDVDTPIMPIPMVPAPDATSYRDAGGAPEKSVREHGTRITPVIRRIIRIPPRPVDDRRLIDRHIYGIGIGGLDDIRAILLLHCLL